MMPATTPPDKRRGRMPSFRAANNRRASVWVTCDHADVSVRVTCVHASS